MTETLTGADVAFFRENGYLLPRRQLLSEERLTRLERIFNEHLADKGDKLSDELDTPHYRDERLLDFLLSDEVLDWIEPLVGPNIALWSSHFISKDPFTGRATPVARGQRVLGGPLRRLRQHRHHLARPGGRLSSRENGCMRVIPGIAPQRRLLRRLRADRHRPSRPSTPSLAEVDEAQAVYFELERGEFSMHDGRIVHGAKPNTSPIRRTGYTMRYFPSSVRMQDVPQNEGWKIWLARGGDLAGNAYANVPATRVKLGLLTACLPGEPLDDIAAWAGSHGYRALEVAAWPDRPGRDWEASHLDVESFDGTRAAQVRAVMDEHGLEVSAIAYYENNLHEDDAVREATHEHLRRCIDAAQLLGVGLVGTFVGRDVSRTVAENLRLAEEVLPPLVEYAAARDVRLVVENCPMEGWHPDGYPANLAYSPELWDWMTDLGLWLNFDPSHLVWLGIDPVAALESHVDRVLHVQAKDVEVDAAARNRYGVFGQVRTGSPGSAAGGGTGSRGSVRSTGGESSTRSDAGGVRRRRLRRARGPRLERRPRPGPPGPRPRRAHPGPADHRLDPGPIPLPTPERPPMHRGVYFDAWFPRQHCYHPSLPPRRLRMVDDLVDYRATVLVWAAMGGGSISLPYLEQEAFGPVDARFRFYGFVNDSEFIAACHEHGIKVFGIVFEAQGWEFPVELNEDEDAGALAQRAARRRQARLDGAARVLLATATPSSGSRSSTTSPTGSSTATASRSPT